MYKRQVQAYLFLQERRFGDRIHFRLSVPEGLPQIVIPGMSVQPVVENAIQHGLENMERGGEIQVLVRRKETCIEVTIRDNGCGMEPELLAAIRRGEEVSTKRVSGGIGLVNVSRRMEIFYKQTELVDIASELDKGTTVTLRYPCREGEEAECTNCCLLYTSSRSRKYTEQIRPPWRCRPRPWRCSWTQTSACVRTSCRDSCNMYSSPRK